MGGLRPGGIPTHSIHGDVAGVAQFQPVQLVGEVQPLIDVGRVDAAIDGRITIARQDDVGPWLHPHGKGYFVAVAAVDQPPKLEVDRFTAQVGDLDPLACLIADGVGRGVDLAEQEGGRRL
jgi:hypothetical protein